MADYASLPKTQTTPYQEVIPRLTGHPGIVQPASPLAIVGLFLEVVRSRFTAPNSEGLPWVWDGADPTPSKDEAGSADNPRKILIESAFSKTSEIRDYYPAIFVDKHETMGGKIVVDNRAGTNLPQGIEAFYQLITVPIDIIVTSAKKGESATIADIVWWYLTAGQSLLRKCFGIQEVTPPVLSRTMPTERAGRDKFDTHISFQVQFNMRWSTQRIGPVLREIALKVQASNAANPDEFFTDVALRDLKE